MSTLLCLFSHNESLSVKVGNKLQGLFLQNYVFVGKRLFVNIACTAKAAIKTYLGSMISTQFFMNLTS